MKFLINPLSIFLTILLIVTACSDDENVEPLTNRLQAQAGPDQEVPVNQVVALDGSGSKDENKKPFAFQWSFKNKPATSAATLQGATTATPLFTPDVAGLYKVELKITQGDFFKTDEVSVVATALSSEPAPITISQNIISDKTLADVFEDPAKVDYLVTKDLVVTAKLTVSPGVVIAFEEDKSLQIFPEGALVAKGNATERIAFTGKLRSKGYWKGILFASNNPLNELDNVSVEFAGSNPLPDMGMVKANLALAGSALSGAALSISNSTIHASAGYGMYSKGRSQLTSFSANYFSDNNGSAIFVPASQLHKVDFFTHYSGNNGFDGVETGGTVNESAEVTWSYFNDGSKYLVTQDLIIESGVRITEGAAFEFAKDIMINVTPSGYLNVTGSDFKPITFTALEKFQGKFWKGIYFASNNTLNKLHHALVSYSGSGQLPGMTYKANVAVGPAGKLSAQHSTFQKGMGWGIVVETGAQINEDVATVNFYDDFVDGYYKLPAPPETTTLVGEWVDMWSLQNNRLTVAENFYNPSSGAWFNGASTPWDMPEGSGFGLKINPDGTYLWTVAEHSPWTGECNSYSAEYIIGTITPATNSLLTFTETYWRSKFYNSCDPDQNIDMNVEPGGMTLRFEIKKMYNLFLGIEYWELKIFNPDGSFFTYHKKVAGS